MNKQGLSTVTRVIILVAFYVVAGITGKSFAFSSTNVYLVWPPFGIALAALLLFGQRFWPGVALGAALFAWINGVDSGLVILSTVIGNTIGALVCQYLLERLVKFKSPLERVRDVAGFVGLACALGTTVTAAFSAAGDYLVGRIELEDLFNSVVSWWVPNAMAGLVVTPLILTWGSASKVQWRRYMTMEGTLCAIGLIAGTLISFHSWYVYGIQNYPLAYLPYPFLVWGALRFGPRGASLGTLVVATLAVQALLSKRGPFVANTEKESLVLIGTYLSVLAVTNLLLAAAAMEREVAEQAVRESEKRYRAVVEDQADLISRFNSKGLLTFVNDAYCRFFRKERNQLLGTYFLADVPEQDRETPLDYFSTLTADNAAVSFDYKVTLPNNEVVWHHSTIRRLFDEAGKALEFQSVTQDITRRKNAEDSIRRAEERLRLILMSLVDGVIVVDHEGHVTAYNIAAEKIFQRPLLEVLNYPLENLFSAPEMAAYEQCLSRQARQRHLVVIETEITRPDGTHLPIDMAANEVPLDSTRLRIIVIRDISERKRMENQFRQSQKMEAVGRLAGGISHDFNNIMQAIVGYTHLLQSSMESTHPDFDLVRQIEKAAERATALTSQLLAFSRKQMMELRLISVNNVVLDMDRLLRRLIGDNIQLELHLAEDLGVVRADPVQIGQVVLNLALNARDAMPNGGTLTVETNAVDLTEPLLGFDTEFRPGRFITLSVIDTGIGISQDVQSHLFEPFFTTKEFGKGTGLGLSIVFGIVKQSGGEITVTSTTQRGTTFRIYLPYFEGKEEPLPVMVSKPAVGGNETILLVEDGDAVRAVLSELFKMEGYHLLEAGNGEEALALLDKRSTPVDLVVSDILMPKMGGRELGARLAKEYPDLPVLFISGYPSDENGQPDALEAASNYLQKPFRADVLLAKVRATLDSRKLV